VSELISARLRRWVRDQGSAPLLTYYDVNSGERTELSGISLANWVAKTSNLLVDELMIDPGDQIELALATGHPAPWVTAVWELACWEVGAVVAIGRRAEARRVVTGRVALAGQGAVDVVACSLHPLGLGFSHPLPVRVLDYSLEVRGQPDQFAAIPQSGLAPAWLDDERRLTQAELVAAAGADTARRLLRSKDPWAAVEGLVGALLGGGSLVVVVGPATDERLLSIAEQEQASNP
jgi:uncharacterized protein (TIGR03089 family)